MLEIKKIEMKKTSNGPNFFGLNLFFDPNVFYPKKFSTLIFSEAKIFVKF